MFSPRENAIGCRRLAEPLSGRWQDDSGEYLLLPMAMPHDRRTLGRVQPVHLRCGGALVAEETEASAFDTAWRVVASWLAGVA
jgi:hypothetical protein